MRPTQHFYNGLCVLGMPLFLFGCASALNMEDDVPAPPSPREVRQLSIPRDLAGNRPDRDPGQPSRVVVPPPPTALMAPAVVAPAPEPVKEKEPEPPFNNKLFAPYLPSVKEGNAPNKWQKQPVYDFPWIPGAEPTRVNEETVVGAGEQMLGRLYAKMHYERKSEPPPSPPVVVAPVPAKEASASKDNRKNKKGRPAGRPFRVRMDPISASRTRRPGSAPSSPDREPRPASERGRR